MEKLDNHGFLLEQVEDNWYNINEIKLKKMSSVRDVDIGKG